MARAWSIETPPLRGIWTLRWVAAGQTTLLAIVDSGPLLASVNVADPDHAACVEALSGSRADIAIPALCVAEVTDFLGKHHGAEVEAQFLDGLAEFPVIAPDPDDWVRVGDLVRRYADLPLGAVDASVAVLAMRLGTNRIVTLDRRHFSVLRNAQGERFELAP